MSGRRRRSFVALVAPVLLSAVALGPLSAAVFPWRSVASADATTTPIHVSLLTLRPVAPQPGDTLVLTGTLRNVSDAPVSDLALELEMSQAVTSRGAFDQYAADPAGDLDGLIPDRQPGRGPGTHPRGGRAASRSASPSRSTRRRATSCCSPTPGRSASSASR